MKTTAISTIIPTYNRAHLLSRAINSVLPQMEPGDELIVVDDGSTDNTAEVVARYRGRVKYVRTVNGGCGAARNRGVKEATCPLVAFLDSDDEWMPEHNLVLRSVMAARPDLLFCFTNFATRFSDGNVRRYSLETQENQELNWEEIVGPSRRLSSFMNLPQGVKDYTCHDTENLYKSLCGASYVSADTLIVRREAAGDSLWFADDTKVAEELECGARLAARGKGLYIHYESTLVHHHTGEQLVNHSGFEMAASRITVMQRIWGADHNFLKNHRSYYEQRLRSDRMARVGGYLVRGRTREARQEIAQTFDVPHSYRMLAKLPGGVTRGILNLRRSLNSMIRKIAVFGLFLLTPWSISGPEESVVSDLMIQCLQFPAANIVLGLG